MALALNQDFVFCPAATYIGSVGTGQGCLVGTSRLLLGLPERVESAIWNHSVTTTTYSVDGKTPGQAIQDIAALEAVTVESFEESLASLGGNCKGAVFVDLEEQKRLKLRAGLCTKGIYWSKKESGPGWSGYGLGSKELTEQWIDFYSAHPLAV